MAEHCMRIALSKTDAGYKWGRFCWDCHKWVVRPAYETREDVPDVPRGDRRGQLRYYLRRAREERPGRRWRRFWVARWFWSAGHLGPVPMGYSPHYWERPASPSSRASLGTTPNKSEEDS